MNKEYFDNLAAKIVAGVEWYEQYLKDINFFGTERGGVLDDVEVDDSDVCVDCGEELPELVKLDPDDLLHWFVGIGDDVPDDELEVESFSTGLDEVTVVVSDPDRFARIFRVTITEL